MTDMLVKLYELPELAPVIADQTNKGITIRRPLGPEKWMVTAWVEKQFSPYWVSECEVAFSRAPITCYVAIKDKEIVGFGCYDTTRRGFFGPTGVAPESRSLGIGKALLLACLHSMYNEGYAYAIIGHVGPAEYYTKAVGATVIEGSTPGIFGDLLRKIKTDTTID